MSRQWFEEENTILSEINITPLVDVSMVLLIIFMITAPMMVQGADVQLPQTQRMEQLPQSQILVSLDGQGTVRIDQEVVPLEELEERLSPIMTPGRLVLFYGDESASYGAAMQIMAVLQTVGAEIGLVTEPITLNR